MKKIGLLLIAVVLIAAGGAYVLLRTPGTPADSGFAEHLPADTLVTLSIRDLDGLTDLFPGTALGHFLSKETMAGMLLDLQVKPEHILSYEKSYDELFSVLQHPAFRMVFGDDVVVAFLPFESESVAENPQQALESTLVVLATTSSSKALETFARALLQEDVSEFTRGELTLTRIRLDSGGYIYAYTKGSRLLLALDPAVIEQCVAASVSGHSLLQEENFINASTFWQESSLAKTYSRGFVQLDRIQPYLLASGDEELKKGGRYLQGMEYVASAGGRYEDGWKVKYSCEYTYDSLDSAVRELVDSVSKQNPTLHLLGENPLLYSWSSSLGASALLETLSASDAKGYNDLDSELQKELGVSLETVVQAFGPQYGGVLKKIIQNGLFPLPKAVFFIQVRNRQVAEGLLVKLRQKIASRGMAGEQQEQIGPYTIYSWSLLPGEATQPAIVLTEDMLYLANGVANLKQVLTNEQEVSRVPESVADNLEATLSDGVQTANNGVVVAWPARFAAQVQGAADWLASMVSASRGGSITVVKDELLVLLQSAEVAVFVSDLFQDRAEATVSIKVKPDNQAVGQ